MKLDREARQFYDPGPMTEPASAAANWEASFDGGETWLAPTDILNDRPRWLVAGPDAEVGSAAVVITQDTLRPQLRLTTPPELIVVHAPYIWLV